MCVCVCVRACVRLCVCVCVRACVPVSPLPVSPLNLDGLEVFIQLVHEWDRGRDVQTTNLLVTV